MSSDTFPSYHNQPLWLTVEEIENPSFVIEDFFIKYSLTEIRADLKAWLQDANDKETIESKEHFATHDEIIKIVEACWVLLHNSNVESGQKSCTISLPIYTEILGKKVPWREMVKHDPYLVIKEILSNHSLPKIRNLLRDWQFVGITTECSTYDEADQRKQLLLFYKGLFPLIEALFVINAENNKVEIEKDKLEYLRKDQLIKPIKVIEEFFEKFPLMYVRRELYDWLEAGLSFNGPWPEDFSEGEVLDTYNVIWCLVESAKMLTLIFKLK